MRPVLKQPMLRAVALATALTLLSVGCALRPAAEYAPGPEDEGFVLQDAFDIAGSGVPEGVSSFYFLLIDDSLDRSEAVNTLAGLMQKASAEQEFLGIAGPVARRNLEVLQAALARIESDALDGLLLIYLGPVGQLERLAEPVGDSGAQLLFMVYPPPDAPPSEAAPTGKAL